MRNLTHILLILLAVVPAYGQRFPLLQIQRFYGTPGDDIPSSLVKLPDGNLAMAGTAFETDSTGHKEGNALIFKVDTDGKKIWERLIVLSGDQRVYGMAAAKDGGIVFCGATNSILDHAEVGYGSDVFAGKIDRNGEIEWLQNYGGKSQDQAGAIVEGEYREYVIAGSTFSEDGNMEGNAGKSDVWFLKLDTRGQKRFSQLMGGSETDRAMAISVCRNGDYLLAGYSGSAMNASDRPGPFGNGMLIRTRQSGEIIWAKLIPCIEGGYLNQVQEGPDLQIHCTGIRELNEKGREFWHLAFSPEGELTDEEIWGSTADETLQALAVCADSGLVYGGFSGGPTGDTFHDKGGEDLWVFRMNKAGEMVWKSTFGGPGNERCVALLEYAPGVFYLLGEKENIFNKENRSSGKDFWLIRLREAQCDSIKPGIFVRADDFEVQKDRMIRFRARYKHGKYFDWDFGDGTRSEEEQPLKAYARPGEYEVSLTVSIDNTCSRTIRLEKPLIVK